MKHDVPDSAEVVPLCFPAVFIAYLWILNGAVNSNSYILAPRLLSSRQKATAAGILAMTYQGAHVIGLLIGLVIVFWDFDGFEMQ